MVVGILFIQKTDHVECIGNAVEKVARLLSYKGYDTGAVLTVASKNDIKKSVGYLREGSDAIIVMGNTAAFYDVYSADYNISKNLGAVEIDGTVFLFTESFDEDVLNNTIIPSLNSKCRTFYTTYIIKTFGLDESELREKLKDYIKNKNRIVVRIVEKYLDAEVRVRYSSKAAKPVVDLFISGITETLKDEIYAFTDISLSAQAAELLLMRGKTISVAESFTGGGVAAMLVNEPGISRVLKEGIVAYSNESKCKRLNVESGIIGRYGAVSIETVYEMAANVLLGAGTDLSLATTGNAGPTSEKENENGVCYIAVGNRRGIHIYKYVLKGDRTYNIECGKRAALFHLIKKLEENEFTELLRLYEQESSAE